jgi:imidazolonepropionase-like amidohydrolase
VSATSGAAEACRLGQHKGLLAPGYDADLIVVAGDTSRQIDTLTNVSAVFLAGRRVR